MSSLNLTIKFPHHFFRTVGVSGGLLLCIALGLYSVHHYFTNRFYPRTYLEGVDVSGLTQAEALEKIKEQVSSEPQFTLTLTADDQEIASTAAQIGAQKKLEKGVAQAFTTQHQTQGIERIKAIITDFSHPQLYSSPLAINSQALTELTTQLKNRYDVEGHEPFAQLSSPGVTTTLKIDPGIRGRTLQVDQTLEALREALNDYALASQQPETVAVTAIVTKTQEPLTTEQLTTAQERATKFVGKRIFFKTDRSELALGDTELINLLTFPSGVSEDKLSILLTNWETQVAQEPREPVFEYNSETLEVTHFVAPLDGLTLEAEKTAEQIKTVMQEIEQVTGPEATIAKTYDQPLSLIAQKPLHSLKETNSLGITELIGFGESEYDHSIPSRIHNVALTTSKINLHIVKPGEEFSFNKTLGEVSSRTGFKPAYVIKNGRTELGDGGGVCQVSTTLFRALLDSGLPITKRKPHSYRVSYYELNNEPGYDATVYAGDVDLRFKNDTGHHVLVYAEADSTNLSMKVELYGTSDGRTTEIKDYQKYGFQAAPPPQYIPDPTLPPGTLKQIDWAATGIKVKFTNVVKDKTGKVIREEEYISNYRPWSAKYLQGVTP